MFVVLFTIIILSNLFILTYVHRLLKIYQIRLSNAEKVSQQLVKDISFNNIEVLSKFNLLDHNLSRMDSTLQKEIRGNKSSIAGIKSQLKKTK